MHLGTRWRYTLLLALLATIFGALAASPATAQSDDGDDGDSGGIQILADELAIFGQLDFEDQETGEEFPAGGVTITVEGVGTVDSDDNGEFRVVVADVGDYTVELDVSTLPDGVNLRNPDGNPLSATVSENRERPPRSFCTPSVAAANPRRSPDRP